MALNSATVSVGDVATATQYNNVRKDIVQFGGDYATTGGTQPTYTLTVESQFVLVAGAIVKGIIHSANAGGAATLNVNGGGAVAIKKFGGGALVAGDLPANAQVIWIYSGSVWNILAISSPFAFLSAKGSLPVASAAGNLIDLVIGTNDKVPVAASGETSGIKWGWVPLTGNNFKNGITSRAGNSTGAQTIAHGFGKTPAKVRITAIKHVAGGNITTISSGVYDGTTTSCVFCTTGSDTAASNDSTNIVHLNDGSSKELYATVALDTTNITLTWSATGSPSADNIYIMWEVVG